MKSAIIANVSHELRTPLTCIIGYNELLQKTKLDDEQNNFTELIDRSARILLAVVNDILDMSKIEAGEMHLEAQPVNVTTVVNELIEGLTPLTNEKGLILHSRVSNNVPRVVLGDARRLKQVLYNLLGNAIKFTEKGGAVLEITKEEDDIVFRVIDTGIGISEEHQKLLFYPFQQLDPSDTRVHPGTGLGLSISKQLVSLMHGKIGVSSEIGKGSTFKFSIPYKQSESVEQTTIDDVAPINENVNDSGLLERIKVLIVDDNLMIQKLVQKQLTTLKVKYKTAYNGKDAINQFLESREIGTPYDIIMMDCQMPIMDGFAATKIIRKHDSNVAIIAMTASIMQEEKTRCFESGMNDVMGKPFTVDIIRATLLKWSLKHP